MNNIKYYHLGILLLLCLSGCSFSEELHSTKGQIETPTPKTELDVYISKTFVKPYNIEVLYTFHPNEVTQSGFYYPPRKELVKPVLYMVNALWIDPFTFKDAVPDETFFPKYTPKQIMLIGNAYTLLGEAEGGLKVSLFGINDGPSSYRRIMHTVIHEFAHILHQNNIYPYEFTEVSKEDYTSSWTRMNSWTAHSKGFVTPYAAKNPNEDFAESFTERVMMNGYYGTFEEYCSQNRITGEAKTKIEKKFAIIETYMKTVYKIDLDLVAQRYAHQLETEAYKIPTVETND